jgi:hypothetical protein
VRKTSIDSGCTPGKIVGVMRKVDDLRKGQIRTYYKVEFGAGNTEYIVGERMAYQFPQVWKNSRIM